MEIATKLKDFTIRPGVEQDVPLILGFVKALAAYEKLSHEVVATEAGLREFLFGRRPMAEVVIGCWQHDPVCFALFFHSFSTFLGRPGLYLEDLFVNEEMRGRGFGRVMLAYLARLARERQCGRLEWSVLDWNTPAIGFYRSLGAETMNEWTVNRLTGEGLNRLAAEFWQETTTRL